MDIFQKIKSRIKKLFNKKLASNRISIATTRQSNPNDWILPGAVLARSYNEYHNKDLTQLSTWDHKTILKILRSVSPEASHAITTYLRVFDSGYSIEVRKLNGEIHQQGQELLIKLINQFEQVDIRQFSIPNSIRDLSLRYALDCLIKGGIAGELIVDKNIKVKGIGYVDAWSIDFTSDENDRWYPVQYQLGKKIILDIPNFFYIPVDPLGDDPYGEEQISCAIQPIIFKTMVMQDLRMAVHTNGWKRLDFKILEESILKNAPPEVKKDTKELNTFVTNQLNDIISTYKDLNPDDNIVHTDSIEVGSIEAGKGVMFDPAPLLNTIDNQISNGLKTFQVLLSKKFGGGSEGFTSSEMILYIKLIGSFQRIVETLFERALSLALRLQYGILANVNLKFNKPELRSDLELSQWRTIEIANIISLFNEGAIGEEEKINRLRELGQFVGPVPEDVIDERITNDKEPNQPERPSIEEDEKERKRKERNRDRRSGKKD